MHRKLRAILAAALLALSATLMVMTVADAYHEVPPAANTDHHQGAAMAPADEHWE